MHFCLASDWLDNQSNRNSNIRQVLQERIEESNPGRELTAEETKFLSLLYGLQPHIN